MEKVYISHMPLEMLYYLNNVIENHCYKDCFKDNNNILFLSIALFNLF